MMNMNAAEFLKTVDHVAAMSDRWLFLAAFCLLLILCGIAIRWLAKELQRLAAEHRVVSEKQCAVLESITKNQNELVLKLIACLDRSNSASQKYSIERRRFRKRR